MKSLLLLIGLIVIIVIINSLTAPKIDEVNITCSSDLRMTYYYQPGCSHCARVEPLIDSLISNGCNITKINAREYPELALSNNITATPTLIFNDKRIVGEFSSKEVKDLISN